MKALSGHLRHREQTLMGATISVTRSGGDPVYDPASNQMVAPDPIVVYAGRALVRPLVRSAQDVQYGGQEVSLSIYSVTLPLTVEPMQEDTITVTTSPDPQMAGLVLVVTEVFTDALPVNRRVLAEVTQ